MTTVMPVQKPGRSVQEVSTPPEFIRAVEAHLGWNFTFDLAANAANSIRGSNFFGPGSTWGEDALKESWTGIGFCWLNPPYADIGPWAEKCVAEQWAGATIAMLIPAAIGTNYFREHIHGKALVLALSPRLTFVGHTQSYPKDLILCVYGVRPGFDCWRWKP